MEREASGVRRKLPIGSDTTTSQLGRRSHASSSGGDPERNRRLTYRLERDENDRELTESCASGAEKYAFCPLAAQPGSEARGSASLQLPTRRQIQMKGHPMRRATTTSARARQQRGISMTTAAVSLMALVALVSTPLARAAGGGPTVNGAVTVTGAVEVTNDSLDVQGVVETLDDVVREPYGLTVSGSNMQILKFDVPTGKRLVVEYVSYFADIPATEQEFIEADFQVGGQMTRCYLPSLKTTVLGGVDQKRILGSQPVNVRVDGVEGETDEVTFLTINVTPSFFRVSLYGYLVDL